MGTNVDYRSLTLIDPANKDNEYDNFGKVHNLITSRLQNFFIKKIKAGVKGYSGKLNLKLIYKEVYDEAVKAALFYFPGSDFNQAKVYKVWLPFITDIVENKKDPASFSNNSLLSTEAKKIINDKILPLTKTVPKTVQEINQVMSSIKEIESSLISKTLPGDLLLKYFLTTFKYSFQNEVGNNPLTINWGCVICDGAGALMGGVFTAAASSAVYHYCTTD